MALDNGRAGSSWGVSWQVTFCQQTVVGVAPRDAATVPVKGPSALAGAPHSAVGTLTPQWYRGLATGSLLPIPRGKGELVRLTLCDAESRPALSHGMRPGQRRSPVVNKCFKSLRDLNTLIHDIPAPRSWLLQRARCEHSKPSPARSSGWR